jgi:transposase InsO family protein/transposase-like protein
MVMFGRWKRRRKAAQGEGGEVSPLPRETSRERAGGEDGAAPAIAGAAEAEPRARARQRDAAPQGKRGAARPARRVFTPEERREAVEAYEKSGRTREDFARLWGCSAASLDKWRKRYRDEGPKGLETRCRPKGIPNDSARRLPDAVRDLIAEVREEHADFGVQRIADHVRRFHGVQVSAGSVRNVLRERGLGLQPVSARRARPKSHLPRRFERARPGELWQSDITSFVLRRHGRRVYLTVFLDDHSRYVVAWALATHQRATLVTEPLMEGISRFGKPVEVLTDQGRQYYAWRGKSAFQVLLAKEGIRHVVSRAHHPETLGKCERLWKTVGDEFWDRAAPQDLDDARVRLGHWIRHYNHFRPHQGIDGLVPADRFFGAEPALRTALERELSANELRLALDEPLRKPVYLVGQIGTERIALHGERGRLVVETPGGGRRELSMQELGIAGNGTDETQEERDGDERRPGSDDDERASDGAGETAQDAHGSQTDGVSQGTTSGVAGAGTLGSGPGGGAGARARDVYADPGVLAREEVEGRGGEGDRREAAARVATLAAGAVGDDGGAPEAAAQARGSGGVRADGTRGVADAAQAADRAPGGGAVADGGHGAGAENGTVAERERGVSREGRQGSWSSQEERASRANKGRGSDASSGSESTAARSWWRFVKRSR